MKNATLALITVAGVMLTQIAFAVTDHQLVITENSSTSLSVTYDGTALTVTPAGNPDSWFIDAVPNITLVIPVAGRFEWLEPGNTAEMNVFTQNGGAGGTFSASSDDLVQGTSPPNDGFTYVAAGTDTSDNIPIDLTFHDNGDTASVPDAGTAGSLFGLSLIGLGFLRRKLC